jgi:hypothetical protein
MAHFEKILASQRAGIDKGQVKSYLTSATAHIAIVTVLVAIALFTVEAVKDPTLLPDLLVSVMPSVPSEPPPPPKPKVEIARQPEPKPEPPKPQELKIEPPKIVKLKRIEEAPEVQIPEQSLKQQKPRLDVAKLNTRENDQQAPDVVVSSRTPGKAGRPELALTSDQLRGAPGVTGSLDAPDPKLGGVQGGKSTKPSGQPRLSSEYTNTRSSLTLHGGQGGGDPDVVMPGGGPGGKGGGAAAGRSGPALTAGGLGGSGNSIKYQAGAPDAGPGTGSAGTTTRSGNSRLDGVRAALASKYGLPLVAVGDIGQRSTDAARWNMLLPELTDLVKRSLQSGSWRGREAGVTSLQRDGRNLVIRYDDGIVHVITLGEDGLAALFVARPEGARAVNSKVTEAENARSALYAYLRGAS